MNGAWGLGCGGAMWTRVGSEPGMEGLTEEPSPVPGWCPGSFPKQPYKPVSFLFMLLL